MASVSSSSALRSSSSKSSHSNKGGAFLSNLRSRFRKSESTRSVSSATSNSTTSNTLSSSMSDATSIPAGDCESSKVRFLLAVPLQSNEQPQKSTSSSKRKNSKKTLLHTTVHEYDCGSSGSRKAMYWSPMELEDMVDDHKYEGRCLGALSQTTPYTLSLKFLHGDPKLTRAQAHSIGLTTDKAIQLVVQHGARGLEKYVCPVMKEYRTHVLQSILTASRQKSPSAAAATIS